MSEQMRYHRAGLIGECEWQRARQLDVPGLAGLCRLQVAVKGEALLAVQTGCCSGLRQSGRTYCALKEAHHNLPFRDAGTATCTDEQYGSVGGCSSLS